MPFITPRGKQHRSKTKNQTSIFVSKDYIGSKYSLYQQAGPWRWASTGCGGRLREAKWCNVVSAWFVFKLSSGLKKMSWKFWLSTDLSVLDIDFKKNWDFPTWGYTGELNPVWSYLENPIFPLRLVRLGRQSFHEPTPHSLTKTTQPQSRPHHLKINRLAKNWVHDRRANLKRSPYNERFGTIGIYPDTCLAVVCICA